MPPMKQTSTRPASSTEDWKSLLNRHVNGRHCRYTATQVHEGAGGWRVELRVRAPHSSGDVVGEGASKKQAEHAAAKAYLQLQSERAQQRISARGRKQNALGKRNEQRILAALNDPFARLPGWFASCRPSTAEEDARGIDVVIDTFDLGLAYLQVKSSEVRKCSFESKRRPSLIACGGVQAHDSDPSLRTKALDALETIRQILLARRHRGLDEPVGDLDEPCALVG